VVKFGTTQSYGTTVQNTGLVTNHSINLTGLTEKTLYHFQVCSTDNSNNQSCSSDQTFTTIDETPPVISNIAVTAISETSATITWTTDEISDSAVDFDSDAAGTPYAQTTTDPSQVISHSVVLTGLTVGTTYHFRVRSADPSGNESPSADQAFTIIDTSSPIISNIVVTNITQTTARVTWNTNESSDSKVEFGLTVSYDSNLTDSTPTTAHTIDITGLSAATNYHFRVISKDAANNSTSSADNNFTTLNPLPPVISAVNVLPSITTARISWRTDTFADKKIEFGTTPSLGLVSQSAQQGTRHVITLTGLSAGTTYHFIITSTDQYSQSTSTVNATFTTLTDTTAPGPVTNFIAQPGNTEVLLTWVNPTDPDRAGTRILRKIGSFPTTPTDGTIIYESVGNSFLNTGLTNDIQYFFGAFAFDDSQNFSVIATTTATPSLLAVIPTQMCTDNDGGENFSMQGTTNDGSGDLIDFCQDSQTLIEYICNSAGVATFVTHDCGADATCVDGRCTTLIPIVTPQCGNAICETGETSLSCPADCPVTPRQETEPLLAQSTVSENERISSSEVEVFVTATRIKLATRDGRFEAFPGLALNIHIPGFAIPKAVSSAYVHVNNLVYAMHETQSYEALVSAPEQLATYPVVIEMNYTDNTSDFINLDMKVVSFGRVTDSSTGQPIAGAKVTFNTYDAGPSGQSNPQFTNANGEYYIVLPIGQYTATIEKTGYSTFNSLSFKSEGDIYYRDFQLIKLPKNPLEAINFTGKIIQQEIKEVIDNEIIEEGTKKIAVPATIVVVTANAVTAGTLAATLIPYLISLASALTQPLLIIKRRKRKQWGIVYNAITKVPIDLAIIRLLDAQTNRIIRTFVTDRLGRYYFITQPGKYKLNIIKAGYISPTTLLKGDTDDGDYADVYHGEVIEVKEEGVITANIPIDPVTAEKTPKRIITEKWLRKGQKWISILGIIVGIGAAIIVPTALVIGIAIGNILIHIGLKRMVSLKAPKSWGVIRDNQGQALGSVIARIFDTRFNKLLETQVSDAKGRYSFLVGKNEYYVTYEKVGFVKQEYGPLNLTKANDNAQTIAIDITLKRQGT